MKHAHVAAGALLLSGFVLGKGAARALDLGAPPDGVQATTTVGLTPAPTEGTGTREEEADPEEDGDAEETPAAPGPEKTVIHHVDEDALESSALAPTAPPRKRGNWQVGVELKRALDSLQPKGQFIVANRGGERVQTTLRADLQEAAENILKDYQVPAGGVIMMDPRTGAILAAAGHSEDGSLGRELAVVPMAPAASIFKIVTGAALLEKGVSSEEETCFVGGRRRVKSRDLTNAAPSKGNCVTFSQALAKSANIPFARMTQEHLKTTDLEKWAGLFQFNRPLPLGVPLSPAFIPQPGGLDFAATGAGFGDVRMSALHGALIASAIANDGIMPTPALWKDGVTGAGRKVMDGNHARVIGAMMEMTVTEGTARKAFRERRRYALGNVRAAGKTGSLAEQGPFRDYSWFVGYAPAENPTVVVSTFIMNDAQWRIRASYVGREMLANALLKGHKTYRPAKDVARR